MGKKLSSKTVHELNCLRNTVKQLKSANEYHKSKIAIYEAERVRMLGDIRWLARIMILLCLALFWSIAYHFLN